MLRRVIGVICATVLSSTAASGARLVHDSQGKIVGVQGIKIDKEYNVRFVEGTCAALFSGCDEMTDFPVDVGGSVGRASVLKNTLYFLGGVSNPSQFLGCESSITCSIYLPGAYGGNPNYFFGGVLTMVGNPLPGFTGWSFGVGRFDKDIDTGTVAEATFAIFTEVTAVPEPATWVTMIAGFALVGSTVRRHKMGAAFA